MAGLNVRLPLVFFSLFVLVIGSLEASVPAIYIFGDSTADVGNNNFLPQSQAKANFPPNGIDFVHGRATGRFSNGLTTADFLAKKLGFKRSPAPFLSFTRAKPALRGVNFASAGSGILEATGHRYVEYISMWKQIQNLAEVRAYFVDHIGAAAIEELFSKSIFFVSTGSNDLIDYFAAQGPVSHTKQAAYIEFLVSTYKFQLRRLYELGARKIGVISAPPTGCCPSQRALNATGGCLDVLNELSLMFYEATETMLKNLSYELPGLKYSLGNLFSMVTDFFLKADRLGFTELEYACCGSGRFNGEGPCIPNSTVCSNRKQYLFWDAFHPTMAASKIAAETLFSGTQQFVSPINFGQLAALDC